MSLGAADASVRATSKSQVSAATGGAGLYVYDQSTGKFGAEMSLGAADTSVRATSKSQVSAAISGAGLYVYD